MCVRVDIDAMCVGEKWRYHRQMHMRSLQNAGMVIRYVHKVDSLTDKRALMANWTCKECVCKWTWMQCVGGGQKWRYHRKMNRWSLQHVCMVIIYVHKVDSSTDKRVLMANWTCKQCVCEWTWMRCVGGVDKNEDIIGKCTYDLFIMPVWWSCVCK